jgi:hypothetical protein
MDFAGSHGRSGHVTWNSPNRKFSREIQPWPSRLPYLWGISATRRALVCCQYYTSREEERIEGRKATTDGINHERHLFCEIVPVAHDDAGHKIMVTRQVLGCAIVDDVRTVFQRTLKMWAPHRIVNHHNRGYLACSDLPFRRLSCMCTSFVPVPRPILCACPYIRVITI